MIIPDCLIDCYRLPVQTKLYSKQRINRHLVDFTLWLIPKKSGELGRSTDLKFENLVDQVLETQTSLQRKAAQAINQSLIMRNWLIGFYLNEAEVQGACFLDEARENKEI